jgi:hypothetical protein
VGQPLGPCQRQIARAQLAAQFPTTRAQPCESLSLRVDPLQHHASQLQRVADGAHDFGRVGDRFASKTDRCNQRRSNQQGTTLAIIGCGFARHKGELYIFAFCSSSDTLLNSAEPEL